MSNQVQATPKTKSELLNHFTSVIDRSNAIIESKKSAFERELAQAPIEAKKDLQDEIKSCSERMKENNAIKAQLAFDDIASVIFTHKIDIESLCSFAANKDTRECKKRLIKTLKAIASKSVDALSDCDSALYSALVSKRQSAQEVTLERVQSIFKHATTTQARYFADFGVFCKFAERSKKDSKQVVSFNLDSAFFKKIASLYS